MPYTRSPEFAIDLAPKPDPRIESRSKAHRTLPHRMAIWNLPIWGRSRADRTSTRRLRLRLDKKSTKSFYRKIEAPARSNPMFEKWPNARLRCGSDCTEPVEPSDRYFRFAPPMMVHVRSDADSDPTSGATQRDVIAPAPAPKSP